MADSFGRIYVLYHPVTGEVRYVGQTVQRLRKRLHGHMYDVKKSTSTSRPSQWIRSLLSQNLEPSACTWANAASREELDALEVYWIAEFRRLGFRLTNHSAGGASDRPTRPEGVSQATRDKLSKANRGQVRTAEQRARISNGNRGLILSLESHEKIRAANIGKKASPESRLKMSASRSGRTPEQFILDVGEIKMLLLEGTLYQGAIAKMFGVHQSFISNIKNGKSWSEIAPAWPPQQKARGN